METKEAWQILRPQMKERIGSEPNCDLIAEFCHTTKSAVQTWILDHRREVNQPTGEQLIRLWRLVAAMGGKLPDFNEDELCVYLGDLFAFDVMSLDDLAGVFNISSKISESAKRTRVFSILRGTRKAFKPSFSMEQLQELYATELLEAKMKLAKELDYSRSNVSKQVTVAHMSEAAELEVAVEESLIEESAEDFAEPPVILEAELVLKEVVPEVPEQVLTPLLEKQDGRPHKLIFKLARVLGANLPVIRQVLELGDERVQEELSRLLGPEFLVILARLCVNESVAEIPRMEELQPTEDLEVEQPEGYLNVKHLAVLLREAAPHVQELFDDESKNGAMLREQLRTEVGQETYSKFAVQVNAMRSRQGYEKAKSGAVN